MSYPPPGGMPPNFQYGTGPPPPYGFPRPGFMHPNAQGMGYPMRLPMPMVVQSKAQFNQKNIKPVNVFIGNITEVVPDPAVKNILEACGSVLSWKRAKISEGKFKAFGYCEFLNQEAAIRAIKLLDSFVLVDKALKVKTNQSTQKELEEYSKNFIATIQDEQEKINYENNLEEKDNIAMEKITHILQVFVHLQKAADYDKELHNDEKESTTTTTTTTPTTNTTTTTTTTANPTSSDVRSGHTVIHPDRLKRMQENNNNSNGSMTEEDVVSREVKRFRDAEIADRERTKESKSAMTTTTAVDYEKVKQRRLERKKSYAESAYKDKMKSMLSREQERLREIESQERRDKNRAKDLAKDAQRHKELMEKYDDDRDEDRYYSASQWQRKLEWRNREVKQDEKDKLKEEVLLVQRKASDELSSTLVSEEVENSELGSNGIGGGSNVAVDVAGDDDELDEDIATMQAFDEQRYKDKGYSSQDISRVKKTLVKNIIEWIPTAKEELFAMKFDDLITPTLIQKRVYPWVNKKICEYIGEEEPSLTEFVCEKVEQRASAKEILDDIFQVLDDEADIFVFKLWRLLAFETKSRQLGLG